MKKNKKILYIGNSLAKKTNYHSAMETLSSFLIKEDFLVIKSSDKKNKFLRLLDMCIAVFKNKSKVDYILIDTFSTTNFYYAFITSQIARIFNKKYIPILHGGNLPNRLDSSPLMSKMIFNNSFRNVAPSNYLKYEFEKRGYEVVFIPNVIEIDKYPFKERTEIKPNLLWVRAFKEIYNPSLAIEVLQNVKKEFPDATLCMVGPFHDDSINKTKELIKNYNLKDSVEITGVLPKEKWHEKSAEYDIFINTTNIDNTPVSVMEAMALGLTIISTNVGGLPYLVDDAFDGILVSPNDKGQMSDAIINTIKNNNRLLAKEARKKVANFDWQVVKNKWIEIIK